MTTNWRYSLDHHGHRAVDFEVSIMVGEKGLIDERRVGNIESLVDVVLRRWRDDPGTDGITPITESEFFDLALADAATSPDAFASDAQVDDPRRDGLREALLDLFVGLADDSGALMLVTHDGDGRLRIIDGGDTRTGVTAVAIEFEDEQVKVDFDDTLDHVRVVASGHVIVRRIGDDVVVWVPPIIDDQPRPREAVEYRPTEAVACHHHPIEFVAHGPLRRVEGGTVSIHPGDALPLRVGGSVIGGLPANGFALMLHHEESGEDADLVLVVAPLGDGWDFEIDADDAPWAVVDSDPHWEGGNPITTIRVPTGVVAEVVSTRAMLNTPGENLPTRQFAVS